MIFATLTRISAAIKARNVVMATGLYQTPKIPRLARDFPIVIKQLHSDNYRNPEQLRLAPYWSSAARNPARRSRKNSTRPGERSISRRAVPGDPPPFPRQGRELVVRQNGPV